MGGDSSKHEAPSPSPSPLLDEPWRKIYFGKNEADLFYVNNYKPSVGNLKLRILLHGAEGAGKSSFINSVQSVLRGRICVEALADATSGSSFTKGYTTYSIQQGLHHSFYPFVFNDIMGLSQEKGVLVEDLILALQGRVKDGYKFNPVSKLCEGDQFYNKSPSDNDKVHVLVCVVPADTLSSTSDKVLEKFRTLRKEASNLGIPQVAVLTKVDAACPEVKTDLTNVYKSKYIKNLMQQFSADVGIPMNCIFPVKNYHEEIELSDDTDSLILSVLKNILSFGDDFISRNLQNAHK